ncbi:Protein kinase domain-containing protein [Mycena chlorophos]|uniref:Protein kinase domain-containing protein n=1 Tax=Mycena chlorophos TaxID=658473 RepID=A0A8H6S0I5_MYCCL|nr:Protein kinase domain-containing protein [Mycena chlorophos]
MSKAGSGHRSPSSSPMRAGSSQSQRTPPAGNSTASFGEMALEVASPGSRSRSRLDLPPESPTSTSRSRSLSPVPHERLVASELLEPPQTPPNAPPSTWWGRNLRGKDRPWKEPTSPGSSTHSSPTQSPRIPPTIPRAISREASGTGKAGQARAKGKAVASSDDWDDDEKHSLFAAPLKRKQTVPKEQTEGWEHTRERVSHALRELLPAALLITHDLLEVGAEVLDLVPIPGLQAAAQILLNIWDNVQGVDMNRLACLRLAERSANLLISVVQEVRSMGDKVEDEMQEPLEKLVETFTQVRDFLIKQAHRPFLKRYLKREDTVREISSCDTSLTDALSMFSISVQMRIYRQVTSQEARREAENRALIDAITRAQQQQYTGTGNTLGINLPTDEKPTSTTARVEQPGLQTPRPGDKLPLPVDPIEEHEVIPALRDIQTTQNTLDFAHDTADLRALLREALAQSSDVEMLRTLQVGRAEMPEALKTLQRALERVGVVPASPVLPPAPPPYTPRGATTDAASLQRSGTVESSISGSSSSGSAGLGMVRDTLDREFIEGGIDALRRMSKGGPMLPSWTITRYEVDRDVKIGIGFFSDVYKGTWRGRTVAIKCLVESTPRDLFLREVNIWRELQHPNVLELYGASGASGDGPWFFVCPYMRFGSLSTFLRRVGQQGDKARDGREGDLLRFMHEIAKGMDYLHGKGVLHGDLKAANVLVDDRIHCLVSDFGQSEMKSEAYRISGTIPPHGTLRWQAPELMVGSNNELTPEMDVYAYAICCIEILLMGRLPWPLMNDDAVRNLVLHDKQRPQIPVSRYTTPALEVLLKTCWDEDPSVRPPFQRIVKEAKQLRRDAEVPFAGFPEDLASPTLTPKRPDWREIEDAESSRPSPDMHPVPLPKTPPMDVPVPFPAKPLSTSPEPSSMSMSSYHTSRSGDLHQIITTHREDTVSSSDTDVPEPVVYSTTSSDAESSIFTPSTKSSSVDDLRDLLLHHESGYESPVPMDERVAEVRNERRYRLLLTHEFHPSLTLALWHPTPIVLGAVGYLHKPSGNFVTLFNCFHPEKATTAGTGTAAGYSLPSVYGYGRVSTGNQRQDKRTAAQRGLDAIAGLLTFSSGGGKGSGLAQNVSRRYSYPLRSGHKVAYLCTETTVYKYMESLDAPKKWFRANIDAVMKQYGALHQIQKEDVYLVIGTLDAPDYGLFVSHNHPDGQAHFNVYSAPKNSQPWGTFTTDAEPASSGPGVGPSYHEPIHGTPLSASKVSKTGGAWETVLVARLRFKPDVLEPTSL